MENQSNQNQAMNTGRKIKFRSIGICILLSIITCGIYGLFWVYSLTEDVNELSKDKSGTSGGMVILFSIITCGVYYFYWMYRQGEKIDKINNENKNSGIIYLVLSIFGLGIVAHAIMQDKINDMVSE